MRRWSALSVLVLTVTTFGAVPASGTAAVCDPEAGAPGGDWPYFGRDLSSTRHQVDEDVIDPDNVAGFEVASTSTTDRMAAGSWGTRRWRATACTSPLDGRVHVNVTTPNGPVGQPAVATAFDAATGERLWTSEPVSWGYTARTMSAPGGVGRRALRHHHRS